MNIIATALDAGNPFAYLLIFIIFEPPVVFLGMTLIEKIKKKIKKRD